MMSTKRSVTSVGLAKGKEFLVQSQSAKTSDALWKQCIDEADICDVKINFKPIDGDHHHLDGLKAHWCVLLQYPYFKAMYDSGLREKSTAVLTLGVVHPAIAFLALKFLYLQSIKAHWKQLVGLITVADYLQLDTLRAACCECIVNNSVIDIDNCVEFLSLALKYKLQTLQKAAETFLAANFEMVVKHPTMMKTSPDFLVALMKNSVVKRRPAMKFFELIDRWVDEREDRQQHLPLLFSCLNLKDFAWYEIERAKANQYVQESTECKAILANYETRLQERMMSGPAGASKNTKDVIVLTGTRESEKSKRTHCYAYVIEDKHWTRFAYPPDSQHQILTVIRGKTYMCGLKEQPDDEFFDEDDRSLELFQLLPHDVKVSWTETCCDNVEWPTFRVLACEGMNDGGMVTVRQSKDNVIKLKVDQPEYVKWVEKKSSRNPGVFIMPKSQQTSLTYDLVTAPEIPRNVAFGMKMEVKKSLVVCGDEEIFIYVHFTDKTKHAMDKEHIFVYNTSTKALTEHSDTPDLITADIAYLEDSKVHLEGYSRANTYIFNLGAKSWETKPGGLPRLPRKPKDYSIVKHKDDVYIIALTGNKKDSVNTLYKLNRGRFWLDTCWEHLSVLPEPGLTKTLCGVMGVHERKVCCPVDCSECSSKLYSNHYAIRLDLGNIKVVEPHSDY